MHFYIDESGNTGNNLSDKSQPNLFYGVLSSAFDLDAALRTQILAAKRLLKVKRLHASNLGIEGIAKIAPILAEAQKAARASFSMYIVEKRTLGVTTFFDQVFDSHNNPAAPFAAFNTPLKFMLILKLERYFTDAIIKDAWAARVNPDDSESDRLLISVCERLISDIRADRDARFEEIVSGALRWASKNPREIHYNCATAEQALTISPNIIGFQYVLAGIARTSKFPLPKEIIVDQQSEFNLAQAELLNYYRMLSGLKIPSGVGLPLLDMTNVPKTDLTFKSSRANLGLEVVDIYLWLAKRCYDKLPLPDTLSDLLIEQINGGETDQISIQGLKDRAAAFDRDTPEINELSAAELRAAKALLRQQEERRQRALKGL